MTLARTVKTQWTQRLRFCFRARQPCERNFKRPQGQELSTELDRHERTKLSAMENRTSEFTPRSDPVNSDANANLTAILGAIPGLIQSLGSHWMTVDGVDGANSTFSLLLIRNHPVHFSLWIFCCLLLENAPVFGLNMIELWFWLVLDRGWSWMILGGGHRSQFKSSGTMTACGCLAWIFDDFCWPSLCRALRSLHSWRVSNGFEMVGIWTVWLVAPSWCTSGNGRHAKKTNNKRLAKREVFKHQVSHWLTCERHAHGLKTSFASTGMVIENQLEGM